MDIDTPCGHLLVTVKTSYSYHYWGEAAQEFIGQNITAFAITLDGIAIQISS
ncbi:hypothetical protein AB3X55_12610 [Alphaproteobacteria bacterium LSUCC0719]